MFSNENSSFSTVSEEAVANEEYIIDSTITYQYNGLKDSIPLYKKVAGDNVHYHFSQETQEWIRSDSTVNYHNDNGLIIGWETFKWNVEQQRWIGNFKIQFNFDNEGRQVMVANYQWDIANGNWKGEGKRTNSFYQNGSIKDEISFNWDALNNDWIEYLKTEYIFDEAINSEIRQNFGYNLSLKEWELISVYRIEKLVEDEMEVRILYRANGDGWTLSSKSEYAYDVWGNLVLENLYIFNPMTNSWDIYLRYEVEAIEKSKPTLRTTSFFNHETQVLEASHKRVDVYDDQFRTTQTFHYAWNLNTQKWIGTGRLEYLYNINTSGKGLNIDKTYKWDDETSDWELEQKVFHYYQNNIISSVEEQNFDVSLILYPNPVADELTIKSGNEKIKELWLYSSSGNLVEVVSDINEAAFKLPFKYPGGLYFLTIRTR